MTTFLTVLHVLVCVFLILVVLLQAGKGGGMGIAFGGAGSQTVFGSSGAGNFLTRLTSITAAVFMLTSLGLAHYSSQQDSRRLQKLAEQKKAQKQAEDARAAKLKSDLEKAAQSAPKAPGTTPGTTPGATGTGGAAVAPTPEMPLKLTPPGQLPKPGAAPAIPPTTPPAEAKGKKAKPAAAPATDETATPPKRKRKPKVPAEEGAAPAAPPAEAPPAPPAQ
jgi:preprotein translocase subunit SecG